MRLLSAIAIVSAMMSSSLWAQVSFAGGAAPPAVSAWGRMPGQPARGLIGGFQHPHPAAPGNFFPTAVFLGNPWLGYETPAPQPAPVIVLQNSPAAAPPPEPSASIEPLLIEWQGDRYVRFSGATQSSLVQSVAEDYAGPGRSSEKPSHIRGELPPAILVFRDGRRERISEYSIINATLYTSGNFWESGSWTRAIPVSTLDLPATFAANRQAGVDFVLPSGPNVVVTRP